jgi:hypothetical protein
MNERRIKLALILLAVITGELTACLLFILYTALAITRGW